MANFRLGAWTVAWLVTLVTFIAISRCTGQATGRCTTVNTCRCIYSDGSYIDLREISKIGKFMFEYVPSANPGDPFLYSYNPCYPVNDTKECQNVAACQKDPQSGYHFPLGNASSANFAGSDDNIKIAYSATDYVGIIRKLTVALICDPRASIPKLNVLGEIEVTDYKYTLTSEYCCPRKLSAAAFSIVLSSESMLCIIFSCLLVVCLVAAALYMKGKEDTSNYTIWVQVPVSMKDKGNFAGEQSFGTKSKPYEDI